MRLFRISNLLCLASAVCCAVLLFWTSQAVQQKEGVLRDARQKLVQEQETVRVLSAEWDYLNRPQRLEELASQQLGMVLASAGGVVRSVDEIPEPVMMADAPAAEQLLEGGIAQNVSVASVAPITPAPAVGAIPAVKAINVAATAPAPQKRLPLIQIGVASAEAAAPARETVSPSKAEKQSFDKLIASLDGAE